MAKGGENTSSDRIIAGRPHALICEGDDDEGFLLALLKEKPELSKFWTYSLGGVNQLRNFLRTFPSREGFSTIRSLCIIRDADRNPQAACQSVRDSLQICGFAKPTGPYKWAKDSKVDFPDVATSFILLPSCNEQYENGTLEDLCLRILKKKNSANILACADCALEPYKDILPELHKNRLHTYFSLTKEFVTLKLSGAAKKKAFDFDSPPIRSLVDFLLQMANS